MKILFQYHTLIHITLVNTSFIFGTPFPCACVLYVFLLFLQLFVFFSIFSSIHFSKTIKCCFSVINSYYFLSYCDECVFAGQNVFLGGTIHLPCPEYCLQSHHSHMIYVIQNCFRMRFKRGGNSNMLPTF